MCCENMALLYRIYSGCDVHIPGNDAHGVSAERAAVLAAVSEGVAKFEVTIYSSINDYPLDVVRYSPTQK
jgi:cytidine deaminase